MTQIGIAEHQIFCIQSSAQVTGGRLKWKGMFLTLAVQRCGGQALETEAHMYLSPVINLYKLYRNASLLFTATN